MRYGIAGHMSGTTHLQAVALFVALALVPARSGAQPGPEAGNLSGDTARYPAIHLALPAQDDTLIVHGPVEKRFFGGPGAESRTGVVSLGGFTSSACAMRWRGCGRRLFGIDAALDVGSLRLLAALVGAPAPATLSENGQEDAALRLEGAYVITRGGRTVAVPRLRIDQYEAAEGLTAREEVTLNIAFFPWENIRLRAEWWNQSGTSGTGSRQDRFSILFDINF